MSIGLLVFEYLFVSTVATLNHFAYDLSGHMLIFGIIAAVNESVWEHEKMGVIPWCIWFLMKRFIFGIPVNFVQVFLSIFTFINTITIIYYSYTYFTHHYIVKIDISSFFIAIGLAMWAENYAEKLSDYNTYGLIGTILILFVVFKNTYFPWKLYYFIDQGVGLYGIDAHPYRCEIKGMKKDLSELKKEKDSKGKKSH